MQNVTALLLMVLTSTLVWSSNTVALTDLEQVTSGQSCSMNDTPASEDESREGGESGDCD